jgi:uncharacterized protein YfbU (UPF0304 family)
MTVRFSDNERLILRNQYQILLHLDQGNAKEYQMNIDILESGFELYYSELFEAMNPGKDILGQDECQFVIDVLNMYRAMHDHSSNLPQTSKSYQPRFEGFDGNEESGHYAFHEFLYRNERFKEIQPQNSHRPMLRKYEKMLDMYAQFKGKKSMSEDDIRSVLLA